jgi:hypothetical protein
VKTMNLSEAARFSRTVEDSSLLEEVIRICLRRAVGVSVCESGQR